MAELDFDFNAFSAALDEQRKLMEMRQAAQVVEQKSNARLVQEHQNLVGELTTEMVPIQKSTMEINRKIQHRRSLEDSGGFLDALRSQGLGMMDPAGYTPKGAAIRLNENQNLVQSYLQLYQVGAMELEAKAKATGLEVDRLKVLETIGAERLNRMGEESELLNKTIAANQTLQENVIINMNKQQIGAALQAAEMGDGTIDIGGVSIQQNKLAERMVTLQKRDYDMLSLQAGTIQQNNELVRMAQKQILQGMSKQELTFLKQNGYKDSTGVLFQPEDVEAAYTRVDETFKQGVQQAVFDYQVGNFDKEQINSEARRLEVLEKRFPSNSAIQRSVKNYKRALGFAAGGAGADKPMTERVVSQMIVEQATGEFNKAIEAQAIIDAKGHLDEKLYADMLREHYNGNYVPLDQIENLAVSRLENRKSLGDFLPKDMADVVQAKYTQIVQQKLNATGGAAMMNQLSESDKKDIRAAAAKDALQFGIQKIVTDRTESIFSGQVLADRHPLKGRKNPQQMWNLIQDSDINAAKAWKDTHGLSDEEAQSLINGVIPASKTVEEAQTLVDGLKDAQNRALLQNLEAIRPGMAAEYLEWWNTQGPEYIRANQAMLETQGEKDLKTSIARTYGASLEQDAMLKYVNGLGMAEGSVKREAAINRANMMDFGSDPLNLQAVLLDQDPELDNPTRKLLFKEVIAPLHMQARAEVGEDFNAINAFIENQLLNLKPENGQVQKALKTLMRNRTEEVQRLRGYQTLAARFLGIGTGSITNEDMNQTWFQEARREMNPNVSDK